MPSEHTEQSFNFEDLQNSASAPSVHSSVAVGNRSRGIVWSGGSIDYVGVLLRYKLWIACGLLCGVVLGHLAYQKYGPEYTATEKVLVTERHQFSLRDDNPNALGRRSEHISIIMSPLIIEKAVTLHQLDQLPSLRGSTDPVEDVLDAVKVQRSAGDDRAKHNVFDIIVKNPRRDDARTICHAIADAYLVYLREEHRREKDLVVADLNAATVDLQQKIDRSRDQYQAFRETAPINLRSTEHGPNGEVISVATNIYQDNLDQYDQDRQLLAGKKAELQSRIQAIEAALQSGVSREEIATSLQLFEAPQSKTANPAPASTVVTVNGQPVPAMTQPAGPLDTQLMELILRERQLLIDYGPDWPEVVTVRGQIEFITSFYRQRGIPLPHERQYVAAAGVPGAGVAAVPGAAGHGPAAVAGAPHSLAMTPNGLDLVEVYLSSLRRQLDTLGRNEEELTRLYEVDSARAREMDQFLEQDRRFNDDIERLSGLWRSYQSQEARLDVLMKDPGYTLSVLAPAKAQLSLKRVVKLYGAGVVAMLGLVGGIIFLREWSDTTLRSVEEIRSSLMLPVLGTIPSFGSQQPTQRGSLLRSTLSSFHRPGSHEAESYRSVRTALLVALRRDQKIIQVTSPEPGDGKSTLIANLAVSMANAGKRVLLIDSDLRRPNQHRLFGVRHSIGVTDVLAGEVDLLTAAQGTVVSGLSVLTSGEEPLNPAELLASSEYGRLLREASEEFDIVLVDTPPLLAVSDPCIVAQRTDGLILVLRMSRNRRNSARRATELLQVNNIPVLGLVLNGADSNSDDYYGRAYTKYTSDARRSDDDAGGVDATPGKADLSVQY